MSFPAAAPSRFFCGPARPGARRERDPRRQLARVLGPVGRSLQKEPGHSAKARTALDTVSAMHAKRLEGHVVQRAIWRADLCPCPAPGHGYHGTPPTAAGPGETVARSTPGAHTAVPILVSGDTVETERRAQRVSAIRMRSLNDPRRGSLWGSTGIGRCRSRCHG